MHFSENPDQVRAEFFRDGGKWYMTEALDMADCYNELTPADAVWKALINRARRRGQEISETFHIVVLDPYHQNPYPVMWTIEAIKQQKAQDATSRT